MNCKTAYLVFAANALIVLALAYYVYEEQQKTGIDINFGETGFSIEER